MGPGMFSGIPTMFCICFGALLGVFVSIIVYFILVLFGSDMPTWIALLIPVLGAFAGMFVGREMER